MGAWRPDLDWITDDLAVGGCFPAGRATALARRHGIGAVVDVRVEACDDPEELAACGLRFLHLPTEDLQGVSQPMLDEGVAFARQMAALADFEVTVTFCFTPEHRGLEPHHTSPPRVAEEFAEFCARMVRRYAPASTARSAVAAE